ncbi:MULTISPECIES: ATP-binding cassette domain-containing protein [unclassified Synechocystis]|uniref:ABC transporter ATP-binding protein n=1 Tax=unclassified Synechocystis TaxID=2640012 RepID=UPI00041ABBDC|nr:MULTISPECIES: ATP-binding cassette domain-containing protein [unclassified Synechocystis]AIE72649.1 YbbL ABC transporter ATP-binding protein [Synechocystis sp. PCC 6714]MCT0254686.1 ATP-binding cassette domain-containing protein [Synechocystis sp. CS-94]
MTSLIKLIGVSTTDITGSTVLLNNISLHIDHGQTIGLQGRSGAGKSTLLRLLNRLQEVSGGNIFYDKQALSKYPIQQLRQEIVLVPQEPKLLGMTVEESLVYPLELQKVGKTECQRRRIRACDIWEIPSDWLDRNELQLSVGQRQLVTLVRAMMLSPRVLLLDEPTSALDPALAQRVLAQLKLINRENGTTMVMVNHTPEYLEDFCQRIFTLCEGELTREITLEKN